MTQVPIALDPGHSQNSGDQFATTLQGRESPRIEVPPSRLDLAGRAKAAKTRKERASLLDQFLLHNTPEHYPGEGVDHLFTAWFTTDPSGALEAINLIGTNVRGYQKIRLTALCCGISAFAARPELLYAKALQCFEHEEIKSELNDFRRKLYPILGELNPSAGVALLEANDSPYNKHYFASLCEQWVKKDPRAAAIEMTRFGNADPKQVGDWAAELTNARLDLEDLKWAVAEKLPSSITNKFAEVATTVTIQASGIETFLKQVSRSGELRGFTQPMLQASAIADPSGFVEYLDSFQKAGVFDRERDAELVARVLYGAESRSALAFFDQLSSFPTAQAKAAVSICEAMLWRDANGCSRWLSSLPSGAVRDAALEPMLDYLRSHNETAAVKQWEALKSSRK